jgi:hypothetical protein
MFTYVSGNSSQRSYVLADATKIEQTTLLYLLIPNFIIGVYPSIIEGYLIENSLTLIY